MKPWSHGLQQMPSYRETFRGIHFNHPPQEVLTVRGDKMWHVEHSTLHLLQQLPQVVVIEWQGTLQGCDRGKGVSWRGQKEKSQDKHKIKEKRKSAHN